MADWRRGEHKQLTKHFSSEEFTCRCGVCGPQMMNNQFLKALECLREEYGQPIIITSGYRCARYQEMLRKQGYETAKGISSHEQGIAADIVPVAKDFVMEVLLHVAEKKFKNIGVGKTFLHVDLRPQKPGQTQRRWSYK